MRLITRSSKDHAEKMYQIILGNIEENKMKETIADAVVTICIVIGSLLVFGFFLVPLCYKLVTFSMNFWKL